MNKRQLQALEKVFSAEINNRLPFQSKAKVYRGLYMDGYLDLMKLTLGGAWPVVISGYQLTHAGRIAYCDSCQDEVLKDA